MNCATSTPFSNRNLLVDLFVILFGVSAWIGITSIYLELPLIVDTAPEGWKLPSYIVIIIQAGNIASLVYVIYEKYSRIRIHDGHLIYGTLLIGCIAAFCLIFLYQHTVDVGGRPRSIFLFTFTGLLSIVGCLSSVLFMPYMGRFREIYLVTFMFGQGLNGLLSSVVSLIQGVGGTPICVPNNSTDGPPFIKHSSAPLFQPETFFLFTFGMLFISSIAFILLNNLKMCKREYAVGEIMDGNEYHYDRTKRNRDDYENIPANVQHLSPFNYYYLLFLLAVISFFGYGMFPGLQSFSCLPYGNTAYHLSVTLSAIANPMACFLVMFVSHASIHNLSIQGLAGLMISSYLIYTSVKSPTPPFVGSIFGNILIVRTYMLSSHAKMKMIKWFFSFRF